MTPDIKTLSDEELVDVLLKLRGEEVYEAYFGSANYADHLAAEVAAVRDELLARLERRAAQ